MPDDGINPPLPIASKVFVPFHNFDAISVCILQPVKLLSC